ncbi:hypothetical protein HK100_009526 [Physocladia obscura]|uniref:Cyclic nucleotide-binding domain-containing protein n=1 Tax=Physocladia obscura TaxID=109957 RepID=A0AAD5SM96_9FUNG|nr:hypothetical protein HK100_009526 [Physocladia obscura]
MLIGHVDACMFWFMDYSLESGSDRWIEVNNLQQAPLSTQYLVSYLAALRSLVLKLREANRDAENSYVIVEFIVGILSYGTVFGNIHSILELMDASAAINQAEEHHNFEMAGIINFMKEKKIKPELQQLVRDYKELQWQKSKGLDADHFFSGVPKSIQQQIKNFLYLDLVQKVPIFQGTDIHFQHMLALKIRPMHILDGWTIFRKGDEGEEMFFIKSGKVEIGSEDFSIIFVTLSEGSFFGEIALFESCKRTATARAKGNCELCTLSKDEFGILMNLYPAVAEGIRETIRVRKMQEEDRKRAADAAAEAERVRQLLEKEQVKASGSLAAFHVRNSNGGLLRGASGAVSKSKENLTVSAVVRAISVRSRRTSSVVPETAAAATTAALVNDHAPNNTALTGVESSLNLKRLVSTIRQKSKHKVSTLGRPGQLSSVISTNECTDDDKSLQSSGTDKRDESIN